MNESKNDKLKEVNAEKRDKEKVSDKRTEGYEEEIAAASGKDEKAIEDFYVAVPPNGGWGWVIVFCALYCNIVIDGTQLAFGVFLKEISEDFGVEPYKVALAGSLIFGVHLLFGPVCGGFNRAFGHRPVSITGTLIACFGVGMSYFTQTWWELCLTFGIIGGIGYGMVFMNTLVVTSLYFTTRLPLAIAIVVCGTGIGVVVFAIGGNFLLKVMTWQHSFLIEAAAILSMVLAILSFKPLEAKRVIVSRGAKPKGQVSPAASDVSRRTSVFVRTTLNSASSLFGSKTWDEKSFKIPKRSKRKKPKCLNLCKKKVKSEDILVLKEVKLPGTEQTSYVEKDEAIEGLGLGSSKPIYRRIDIPNTKISVWQKLRTTISATLDCRLLSSSSFFVFSLFGALCLAGYIVVFVYEKERCIRMGFSVDFSGYFIASLGASNVFWRLCLGWIGLVPKVPHRLIVIIGQIIGGIATIASGYYNDVYYQFAFTFLFGMAMGSMSVLRIPITIDIVGHEFLENALGINLLFMGLACIIFPSILGLVAEILGDYNVMFIISGSFLVLTGLSLICLKKVDTDHIKRRR